MAMRCASHVGPLKPLINSAAVIWMFSGPRFRQVQLLKVAYSKCGTTNKLYR